MNLRYGTLAGAVAVLALGMVGACSHRGLPDDGALDGSAVRGDETGLGGDGATGCALTCSADLRSVIDCNSQIVKACPADKTCGAGDCLAPCDAAAANKSSIGCDYYTFPPDSQVAGWGGCFAAFVTNTWTAPMKVTLVWKGMSIDATPYAYTPTGSGKSITYQPIPMTGIPSNSMAIVFLNQTKENSAYRVSCPASVKAAVESENMVLPGTHVEHAMEIKTSVPAVVYDIYPFGGASSYIASATLLLPTSAWDTNYVATTMGTLLYLAVASPVFIPGIDIVAQDDNTTVTVLPSTNITAANGVAGAAKNAPVTYAINKGQTLHIQQLPDNGDAKSLNDLSGSVVQSNKPVGVWGEHSCMMQEDPAKWRIIGAAKGTTLTYDPPVATAPATLTLGQLVEFDGPGAFHVKSQDDLHPFYLAAHRPGRDCDAAHQQIPPVKALGNEYAAVGNEVYGDLGGPETVNVVPPAQFLSSYIFFTDPTFGYTDLALVRKKASDNAFKDVTLDCLGTVGGWQAIGNSGFQYTHVRVQHQGAPVGGCDNGLHTVKSAAPFGVTVWGYDAASSYAYPAGASVKPINTIVVPPTPN